VYDRDIPEFPFVIDRYLDCAVIYDKGGEEHADLIAAVSDVVAELVGVAGERIFRKERRRQKGLTQYEKLAKESKTIVVREDSLRFEINLSDYLDTGLFLDHRPLRHELANLEEPPQELLNLFSYTGSLSVAAANSGVICTSVDLSNTYLSWSERNFRLNSFDPNRHYFIKADILKFLDQTTKQYEMIILDPPTFSNSKSMTVSLDIQRDHLSLIQKSMRLLATRGCLVFSTNRENFKLAPKLNELYLVRDVSSKSVPSDFKKNAHKCFVITRRESPSAIKLF